MVERVVVDAGEWRSSLGIPLTNLPYPVRLDIPPKTTTANAQGRLMGHRYSSCRTGHRRVSDEIAVVTRGEAKFEGPPEAVPDALMRVGQAGVNRIASRQTDSLFLCVVTGVDRCAT